MFCVVYQLCRVRGAKAVVRLMPHEAAELEPVIHALQAQVKPSALFLRHGMRMIPTLSRQIFFNAGMLGACRVPQNALLVWVWRSMRAYTRRPSSQAARDMQN